MANVVNGVELDTVRETMAALEQDPSLGECTFRASNEWLEGTRTVSRFSSFRAVKQEMEHPRTYELRADQPPIIGGTDSSANPAEYLLGVLSGCVTSSMIVHAAVRGIQIAAVESDVEGDLDLNGFAGLSEGVPKGYQRIRMQMRVKSDADVETLKELAEFSPTLNTIRGGTRVEVSVDREPLNG